MDSSRSHGPLKFLATRLKAFKASGKRRSWRNGRPLNLELLDSRVCLSALGFDTHVLTRTSTSSQLHAADISGDGHSDLVLFSHAGIEWFENVSAGKVWKARTVTHDFIDPDTFVIADIDGDDDFDIVATSGQADKLAWYENTDGAGEFAGRRLIATGLTDVRQVKAEDLDHDGDIDLLVGSNSGPVVWQENIDGQGTFTTRAVGLGDKRLTPHNIVAVDLDADGDLDILANSFQPSRTVWFPNMNGRGDFGTGERFLGTGRYGTRDTFDVDGDGDLDVLAQAENGVFGWIENLGIAGQVGKLQVVLEPSASRLLPVDFDADSDLDFLEHNGRQVWLHRNIRGISHLEPSVLLLEQSHSSLIAADVSNDGHLDLVIASEDGQVLVRPRAADELSFGESVTVTTAKPTFEPVDTADLDGDSDADLVVAVNGTLAWLENAGGQLLLDSPRTMHADYVIRGRQRNIVRLHDLDGDGDIDLTTSLHGVASWYENLDGRGTFGPQNIIANNPSETIVSLTLADMDADNRIDVVVTSHVGNVYWHRNVSNGFADPQLVTTKSSFLVATAGDLDGDGHNELVVRGEEIEIYRYNRSEGGFGEATVIADVRQTSYEEVALMDLDGDGDLDIVSATRQVIVWFENNDGTGGFAPAQFFGFLCCGYVKAMEAIDMDGDGDLDLYRGYGWYENRGPGQFGSPSRREVIYVWATKRSERRWRHRWDRTPKWSRGGSRHD